MRVAETRAVNRALRKAYGIGICSVEEIGSFAEPAPSSRESKKLPPQPVNGKNGNYGGPKVRDRLCQLIRQHQLDANLVKSYAVDFCGTKNLREASREQVENFVAHLADWAEKDRNALLCQLNSYPGRQGRCRMSRHSSRSAERMCQHSSVPDGIFLVRVDHAQYRWHSRSPITRSASPSSSPASGRVIHSGRLYCTPKALWKLGWFLRDFGYDPELLGEDEIDEKALVGLRGVVKVSQVTMNGISDSTSTASLRQPVGRTLASFPVIRSSWF